MFVNAVQVTPRSELAGVLPQIASCRGAASLIRATGPHARVRISRFVFVCLWCKGSSHMLVRVASGSARAASGRSVAKDVDRLNGIDTEGVSALVKEARRIILAARSALI